MKHYKTKEYGSALLVTLLLAVLSGCSTETIDTWGDDTALAWFSDNDSFNFSFAPEPEQVTQVTRTIDIQLATPVKNQARDINLEVVRQPQNSQTRIEFVNPVTVEAGASEAKLQVTFFRTPNLSQEVDTLVLRIVPSDDFKPGIVGMAEKTIVVSATYLKPQWWDTNVNRTLGECNQLKLKIFYNLFGSLDDIFGGNLRSSSSLVAIFQLDDYAKRHYGKAFKNLLETDKPL